MREDPAAEDLFEQIIKAAIEVHRSLGPGLVESVYGKALCYELNIRNIEYECRKTIPVIYKGQVVDEQCFDLIVGGSVLLELDTRNVFDGMSVDQMLAYLRASGLKRGLLINFGRRRLDQGIKRVAI